MNIKNINVDTNLKDELIILSKELDCMGLPPINVNVDVVHQLMTSATKLVQMYRLSLTKMKDININKSQLEDELKFKKKKVDMLKDEINEFEEENKKLTNKLTIQKLDIDTLKQNIKEHEGNLERARLYNKNKDTEWSHKAARLQLEIDKLRHEPVPRLGYDEQVVKTIAQYKIKEDIYKNTIRQLQENNDELQRQILNIRDEVLNLNT